jgi:versiconal hemiacetal acetate esterase
MVGDLNMDDPLCRIFAENGPCILISVDYSLTPEHKWPTQLDECMKVYKWARQNASSYGGDADKMFTMGGSAGGGLALQIANRLVKNPDLKGAIRGILAIVPLALHYDNVPSSLQSKYKAYDENGPDSAVINKESMKVFYDALGGDIKDPELFTALATDNHKNFPPTYVCVCEKDPLRDDGYIIEELLRNAGVPTKIDNYPGQMLLHPLKDNIMTDTR